MEWRKEKRNSSQKKKWIERVKRDGVGGRELFQGPVEPGGELKTLFFFFFFFSLKNMNILYYPRHTYYSTSSHIYRHAS